MMADEANWAAAADLVAGIIIFIMGSSFWLYFLRKLIVDSRARTIASRDLELNAYPTVASERNGRLAGVSW